MFVKVELVVKSTINIIWPLDDEYELMKFSLGKYSKGSGVGKDKHVPLHQSLA